MRSLCKRVPVPRSFNDPLGGVFPPSQVSYLADGASTLSPRGSAVLLFPVEYKMIKLSEKEVGAWVRDFFLNCGWDVYCEVVEFHAGPRADIVATRGPVVMVCEIKTRWSVSLLEQSGKWTHRAHQVIAAAPGLPKNWEAFKYLAERFQIGLLNARKDINSEFLIHPPTRHRAPGAAHLKGTLVPEQRTFAPPGSMGEFWSPYQSTCRSLLHVVNTEPGIFLANAVKRITHHYSSNSAAAGALATWIRQGAVKGVALILDGHRLRLYPAPKCDKEEKKP